MARKITKRKKYQGRPIKFTNDKLEELKKFMEINPTIRDTAAFFDCGVQTLVDNIRHHFDMTFSEFKEAYLVKTKYKLAMTALDMAYAGDVTMLIFCLKNFNKWKDKHEAEIGDINIQVNNVQISVQERIKILKEAEKKEDEKTLPESNKGRVEEII